MFTKGLAGVKIEVCVFHGIKDHVTNCLSGTSALFDLSTVQKALKTCLNNNILLGIHVLSEAQTIMFISA